MDYWSNTRVTLNDAWGGGGVQHSLSTPLGAQQMPEFSLRARHLRDPSGSRFLAHFTIDFASGFLADGWQGVNFVPMGDTPPGGISSLPVWDGSAQVKASYRQVIDAAIAASLGKSQTRRLEAVIPYLDQGQVGYNKVRLFYVSNAVSGPVSDLVVVTTVTHSLPPGTVQGRQNGQGQGPPD